MKIQGQYNLVWLIYKYVTYPVIACNYIIISLFGTSHTEKGGEKRQGKKRKEWNRKSDQFQSTFFFKKKDVNFFNIFAPKQIYLFNHFFFRIILLW